MRTAAFLVWGFVLASFASAQSIPALSYDESFGPSGGLSSFPFSDLLGPTVAHPNGSYYGASGCRSAGQPYPGLYRWTADGHPDSTFGGAPLGCVAFTALGSGRTFQQLATHPDGKLLAVGKSGPTFFAYRFAPDGTPDATFGTNGLAQTTLTAGTVDGLCPLPNQRAVAFHGASLLWLSAQGQIDSTTAQPTTIKTIHKVACRADGSFTILGFQNVAVNTLVVARLTPAGKLDLAYGTNGLSAPLPIEQTNIGTQATGFLYGYGFRVSASGLAYVAGTIGGKLAASRLAATGALDASFGTGGTFILNLTGTNTTPTSSGARSLMLLPDGSALVGGTVTLPSGYVGFARNGIYPIVAHVTNAGQLGTTFGGSGVAGISGIRNSQVGDLHGTADGKLVAVLGMNNGGTLFVARYPTTVATGREDAPAPAAGLSLTVSPNPIAESSTLAFGVSSAGSARLAAYDVLGREVALFYDGQLSAGLHRFAWNAHLPAGLYFVRGTANGASIVRTVVRR